MTYPRVVSAYFHKLSMITFEIFYDKCLHENIFDFSIYFYYRSTLCIGTYMISTYAMTMSVY